MEVLLAELARDSERRRRRLTIGAALAVLLVVIGAGAQRTILRPVSLCKGADEHLAGIWELGGAAGTTPRRDAIRGAFMKAGGASGGDTWQRVSATLDRYARAWTTMSTESCEATHVRGEQSASVLDLRTTCLGAGLQKLRAVTDVFVAADLDVVRQAVDAANALPDVARCGDVKALLAVTPLPSDRETRAKIEALRRRLSEAEALRDAGKMAAAAPLARALVADARVLAYDPTLAETLMLDCLLEDQGGGQRPAAVALCEEAVWAAEASRDDEVGATAATQLVGITAARGVDSRRWVRFASAILKRMGPGHGRIEGWLAHNEANAALEMGDPTRARTLYERAIALKTAAEGPEHPDVAITLNSLGNALHELGAHEDGLAAIRRAAVIFAHAYGPGNRWVGVTLNDEGEILAASGRGGEALPLFEKSVAILEADTDRDSPWVAYPLTGKGLSLLLLGRPREAIAPLERGLALRAHGEDLPMRRGETRFALARALWDAGENRARARALATSAREEYLHATKAEKNVAEIDAWLAAHRKG
jgi:tetratricopeptide (TPR) repeat protein